MLRRHRGEQRQRLRAAAPLLGRAFAKMDSVRLELSFSGVAPLPAPQTVVLHAGAPAWFEFPCPCADCDGSLDLATQVAAALKAGGRRTAGSLGCPGGRVLGGQTSPCSLKAAYVITGTPRTAGD
jgi:hypothetical protein